MLAVKYILEVMRERGKQQQRKKRVCSQRTKRSNTPIKSQWKKKRDQISMSLTKSLLYSPHLHKKSSVKRMHIIIMIGYKIGVAWMFRPVSRFFFYFSFFWYCSKNKYNLCDLLKQQPRTGAKQFKGL